MRPQVPLRYNKPSFQNDAITATIYYSLWLGKSRDDIPTTASAQLYFIFSLMYCAPFPIAVLQCTLWPTILSSRRFTMERHTDNTEEPTHSGPSVHIQCQIGEHVVEKENISITTIQDIHYRYSNGAQIVEVNLSKRWEKHNLCDERNVAECLLRDR